MADDSNKVQCVPKAEFDMATLTGSYQAMNGTGFTEAVKILKIYNPSTTVSIDVSLDGTVTHDFIPPLSTLIVDFQTNHNNDPRSSSGTLRVGKGQILYGKTAVHPTYLQMIGYL